MQGSEESAASKPDASADLIERECSDALRDVGDDHGVAGPSCIQPGDLVVAGDPDDLAQLVDGEVVRFSAERSIQHALFDQLSLTTESPELVLAQYPELLVEPDAEAANI